MSLRAWLIGSAIVPAVVSRGAVGPRYGGEATIAVPSLPASLAPARAADVSERLALALVHETLVALDESGQLQPRLARSWTRGVDEREWLLELDADARFHDDAPLTAADAARSLRRFLEGRSPAARTLAAALEGEGIWTLDALHLGLRFRAPETRGLQALASLAAAITSPGGAGAGPFLPTHLVPGQRLALTAFTGHVRGRPFLDRLTLLVMADEGARTAAVATSRASAALEAGPVLFDDVARLVLAMDPTHAALATATTREAIAGALRAAELASFIPGAKPVEAAVSLANPPPRPLGALGLTVASDVPRPASQRVVAVLESLGAQLSVVVEPPGIERGPGPALRLLLEAPEIGAAEALDAERRAHSDEASAALVLPLVSVPGRFLSDPRLQGLRFGGTDAATIALDDVWMTAR